MSARLWQGVAADAFVALAGDLAVLLIVLVIMLTVAAGAYLVLRHLGVDVRVTRGEVDDPASETPGRSTGGTSRFSIETIVSDPIVYRLDAETLERARNRIAAGEVLDVVCRDINPAYATWDAGQQEAFRRVVEAALREGDRH